LTTGDLEIEDWSIDARRVADHILNPSIVHPHSIVNDPINDRQFTSGHPDGMDD
jgi:hypothetical protein